MYSLVYTRCFKQLARRCVCCAARIKTYLSTIHTRDRVQGLRRSKRAHETPMRSRRFVALFGGRAADRPGERGMTGGRDGDRRVGSSDRGSSRWSEKCRRNGTARHASARATWRETIRANNRQEAPSSWRERRTTVVLNLAFPSSLFYRNNKVVENYKMVILAPEAFPIIR